MQAKGFLNTGANRYEGLGAGMSLCLKQGKESSVLWPKWSEGERWRGEKGSRQITWAVWAAVGSFRFFLKGMGSY